LLFWKILAVLEGSPASQIMGPCRRLGPSHPKWFEGKGQIIDWKVCDGVTSYKDNRAIVKVEECSGEMILHAGSEMYIVGGYVREV
jgi:hypothetical protein